MSAAVGDAGVVAVAICIALGAMTVAPVTLTILGLVFGANFAVKPRDSGPTLLLSTVAGIGSLSVVIALLPSVS